MTVEEQTEQSRASEQSQPAPTATRQAASARGLVVFTLAGAIVLGFAIAGGLIARAKSNAALLNESKADATPTVSVIHPQLTSGAEEIVLPGNMQAFIDTPIWARASGYLKAWYVDIGAHVRRGQLLAEIEAPEVDQQLQQAR